MAPRARKQKYKIVKVGRFDDSDGLKDVVFDNGNTVGECLRKAGYELNTGEEVNDLNGKTLKMDSKVKHGQSLIISGSFKSGN
jgi:hypothetical protein